jgi:LCP family protein required for cell wall assembly
MALVTTMAVGAAVSQWLALPLSEDGMYVLLVMGSDEGPPREDNVLTGRADAIQLVVVDGDREHVSILSIPRDSYVPVRGFGTTKINEMLTLGATNAVRTIEDLTGLEVDDWIVTGFDAVILGIDEFGGVHVDVERQLRDSYAQTDLEPGYQELNGWQTLAYTRDRNSRPDGDVDRSTAQATVLRSLHAELLANTTSPARLVDFAAILRRYSTSSLSAERLFRLGVTALQIDPDDVAQVTLPGTIGYAGPASVYRLADGAFDIFEDLGEDGLLEELEAPTAPGRPGAGTAG